MIVVKPLADRLSRLRHGGTYTHHNGVRVDRTPEGWLVYGEGARPLLARHAAHAAALAQRLAGQ